MLSVMGVGPLKRASGVRQQRIFSVTTPSRSQRRVKSLTTTNKLPPVHPGEVLMEDSIEGFSITQNKLAVPIGVPQRPSKEMVHG